MTDIDAANVTSSNVTDAGMYLFYAILAALGSLASLIILVAVLTMLISKLGFGHVLKFEK